MTMRSSTALASLSIPDGSARALTLSSLLTLAPLPTHSNIAPRAHHFDLRHPSQKQAITRMEIIMYFVWGIIYILAGFGSLACASIVLVYVFVCFELENAALFLATPSLA